MADQPNPPNRPPLLEFDPEIGNTIVSLLQEGNYLETAAGFVGVSVGTAREWMRRGARDRRDGVQSVYSDFSTACKKARSADEISGNRTIRQAGQTQWQAEAWRMERKYFKRWGKREHVEHSGELKVIREYVGANPDDL